MQRLAVKNMLRDWEQKFPGRIESIFSSICNVAGSQLADPELFDFAGLDGRAPFSPMTEADEDELAARTRATLESAGGILLMASRTAGSRSAMLQSRNKAALAQARAAMHGRPCPTTSC